MSYFRGSRRRGGGRGRWTAREKGGEGRREGKGAGGGVGRGEERRKIILVADFLFRNFLRNKCNYCVTIGLEHVARWEDIATRINLSTAIITQPDSLMGGRTKSGQSINEAGV